MDTVLLIEDEPDLRELFTRILMRHGYEVIDTATVDEARRALKNWRRSISVVMSDINLKDGNSRDLHNEVKDDILTPHQIGWVAMTGQAEPEDVAYFSGHSIEVLSKPVGMELIRRTIEHTIKRNRPTPIP